ncbi:gas vesicle protein [Streptomyces sp. NBRC 110035]|uniref:gas vesicle protein GvpO n=1 Tax=Streptomyces sp. NBRC 110035 TaxID=1547867 RepID=UPI00099C05DF|nr:gas vesicle protein [Streptomyces sp. NBRC 110035]
MSNTKNTSESQNSQQSSRKSQNSSRSSRNSTEGDSKQTGDTPAKERRPSPMEVLRQARDQFAELTGLTVESVSSFGQTEAGWTLEVEVLELERVPDTMSLLASYQVEIDSQGQLAGYRRVRRYERGRADVRGSGGR